MVIPVVGSGSGGMRLTKLQCLVSGGALTSDCTHLEGTGIGMTISKNLVELMNGRINVHSTMGKGSQFSVSLPSCDPKKINKKYEFLPLESSWPETSKQKLTVLYIEDNKTNVLLVQDVLSDFPEVNILAAPQAAMGLDLAHAHQPDLILLDINLPDMDGYEALKRLQNMEETHNIPVIALSANAMQKDIDRAKEAGFKDYITKPIDIFQLKYKIDEYVLAKKSF